MLLREADAAWLLGSESSFVACTPSPRTWSGATCLGLGVRGSEVGLRVQDDLIRVEG